MIGLTTRFSRVKLKGNLSVAFAAIIFRQSKKARCSVAKSVSSADDLYSGHSDFSSIV